MASIIKIFPLKYDSVSFLGFACKFFVKRDLVPFKIINDERYLIITSWFLRDNRNISFKVYQDTSDNFSVFDIFVRLVYSIDSNFFLYNWSYFTFC